MDRRTFFAAGLVSLLAGCATPGRRAAAPVTAGTGGSLPVAPNSNPPTSNPAYGQMLPPAGLPFTGPSMTVTQLPPGSDARLALTIDDGIDTTVVAAYLDVVERTGQQLTFFPNGIYPAWTTHADRLRPLVRSGQVQLGNHTWSHPDLTRLPDTRVLAELRRNHVFLVRTFGVDPRPWWRPPYGAHDSRVDALAASLGYTRVTLWAGSLGDARLLTSPVLMAQARRWLTGGRIVIGHANHPTVIALLPQIEELLRERNLELITLARAADDAARNLGHT